MLLSCVNNVGFGSNVTVDNNLPEHGRKRTERVTVRQNCSRFGNNSRSLNVRAADRIRA